MTWEAVKNVTSGAGRLTVAQNPNTDPHSALKKAVRRTQHSLDLVQSSIVEQGKISTDDDRVQMVEDLSFAIGLVEGYIEGREWVANAG